VHNHRCGTAVAGPDHHCQVQLPCATRREGEGGAAEAPRPPRLPTRPPALHPSRRLHQPAATERDHRINHHRIRKGDGGRGSSRGLTAFQAALTRSTRHAAFAVQLPPRATDVLTSRCNRRGRRRKGEQPRPTGGLPGCCLPATPPPPPHVQPPGERAQTPTAVESDCRATRSGLLAPLTGRIQPPRAARRRLTAEEDEPQPGLQARCPPGAVQPPPHSPTRKNTPPDAGARAAPQEERGASPPPSLLALRVVPRGQLRRRRGRGGGRGGGGGREWKSPPVSPLRRRGGRFIHYLNTTISA
jgi:hypothetical protein